MGRCPVVCGQLPSRSCPLKRTPCTPSKLYTVTSRKRNIARLQMCLPLQCCNLEKLHSVFLGSCQYHWLPSLTDWTFSAFFASSSTRFEIPIACAFFTNSFCGYLPFERYSSIKFSACSDFFSFGIPLNRSSTEIS